MYVKMLLIFWLTTTLSPGLVWCQQKDGFSSGFGLNSSQHDLFSPNLGKPAPKENKDRAKSSVKDFSITYQRKVFSLRSLMRELTQMGVETPSENDLLRSVQETKRISRKSSCKGRCGLGQRNKTKMLCFCDIHCSHFGDCCYDFHSRCPSESLRDSGPQTCENANNPNVTWYGEAMISTCPQDKESRCFSSNRTLNLRWEVPVVNRKSKRTYRSVTCASCNNITDVIPWVLTVRCSLLNNVKHIVDWLKRHPGRCNWKYKAPSGGGNDVKCILGMTYSYAPWQRGNLSVICDICNSYAMVFRFKEVYHRNPHCVLCDPKAGKVGHSRDVEGSSFRPPSLTVFFNFNTNERLLGAPDQHNNTNMGRAAKIAGQHPERVITMVGCCVSIAALLVLIVVYALFKELRNLPGKVLMNLACSIICYQALFLSADQTGTRAVCMAIAMLLHYFLMVSFTWMAVMGYDLAKTFTSKGANVNQESTLKTLVTYCSLAWGGPLILVAVCLTLDVTSAAYFGYGMGEYCWIHSGLAKIFSVGIPVALALLFNIVALVRTMIAIHQTKKATQRVATQRDRPSLAFLCFKLTMVLGVPWVLGYVANYALVLQYVYVVLNAFQGLFISLVFLANKRVFKLIRRKAVCNVNSEDTATREIRSQTTRATHGYHQETKSFEQDCGMIICTSL